ncbi:MAG TPA: sulfotransferase [Povalibacter sp.]
MTSRADQAREPIFLCGAPRSGVRLLAAILNEHPQLASGPELPFLITMARQWSDIEHTLGENHQRHYGLEPAMTRSAFRAAICSLLAPRLAAVGKPRFVIQSFAAALSLEALAALFPNARFLLMVRDPRAVAGSLLRCDWRNPRDGQRLPYTRDPVAGTRLWMDFMNAALPGALALQQAGRLAVVRYEDLCARPAAVLHGVTQFLGEPVAPEPRVVAASASLITLSEESPHPPLREGLLDTASIRPRTLDPRLLAAVEQMTGPLRSRFGY